MSASDFRNHSDWLLPRAQKGLELVCATFREHSKIKFVELALDFLSQIPGALLKYGLAPSDAVQLAMAEARPAETGGMVAVVLSELAPAAYQQ